MPIIDADFDARVARGAALLDKARPGWDSQIALDELAMESCDRCILGQLYGHYERGLSAITAGEPSHVLFRSSSLGFTLKSGEQNIFCVEKEVALAGFAMLGDAWRRAIRSRIGGGP